MTDQLTYHPAEMPAWEEKVETDRVQPSPAPKRRRRNPHRPVWDEEPSRFGSLLKGIVLLGVVFVVAFPLYTIALTSFSTTAETVRAGGLVLVPGDLTLEAYRQILSGGVVTRAILVSVGVTAVGTLVSTGVSVLAAYGLSRSNSFGHRPILFIFLITMFFGAGIIPTYLLVSSLGLINTWWALILPGAVSAFYVLILRNFFMGVDQSVLEAARMDGASDWRVLFQIVLPMSGAVIAVVSLFYGVGYFNSFFDAMLYLNDSTMWPLQMILRSFVMEGVNLPGAPDFNDAANEAAVTGLPIKMAVVMLALVPILIAYPFVQRHFTKGVIFGAIKG